MSRGLRRSGLAAGAGLVLALTAACSSTSTTSSSPASSASSPAGATGTLIVFGAGTLSTRSRRNWRPSSSRILA